MKGAATSAGLIFLCVVSFLLIHRNTNVTYDTVQVKNGSMNRRKSGTSNAATYITEAEAVSEKMSYHVQPKSKRKSNDNYNYHDDAVLITHYHKTGYVLSRELMFLVQDIEIDVRRPDLKQNFSKHVQFEVSGVDEETGDRFAFDQVGSWVQSAFTNRRHSSTTQCPMFSNNRWTRGRRRSDFQLNDSTIYVQESPDFFCEDRIIRASLCSSCRGAAKIIHFIRNPYEMLLSNYFYHSLDPTPENWVHADDPCENRYDDGETLSSHVLPTLASEFDDSPDVLKRKLDGIVSLCHELFRSRDSLKNSSFYEHLSRMEEYDGLLLSSVQMIAASGMANRHRAGGDILRMANNLIRFRRLADTSQGKIELLTVSMDDFIRDPATNTFGFLNFIFGRSDDIIPKEKLWEAARAQAQKFELKRSVPHVTQTKVDGRGKRILKDMLKKDSRLNFILDMTEVLVNDALAKGNSEDTVKK